MTGLTHLSLVIDVISSTAMISARFATVISLPALDAQCTFLGCNLS
ncbi:hypothetical protein FHX16_006051 [Rhizobium sp. BK661]|nr:hypothetical protein [Rhizobium sp. BK661]